MRYPAVRIPTPQAQRLYVQRGQRRSKSKLDCMRAGRQEDAAHKIVAAEKRRRLLIDPHSPRRSNPVVEQQDGRRYRVGLQFDALGVIIGDAHGARIELRISRRLADRRILGNQNRLFGIKFVRGQDFQSGVVVRSGTANENRVWPEARHCCLRSKQIRQRDRAQP